MPSKFRICTRIVGAITLATVVSWSAAQAANVSVHVPDGSPGTLGTDGSELPGTGGPGDAGGNAARSLSNIDSANSLDVRAGAGGFGGAGGHTGALRGNGGEGGRGGDGSALVVQHIGGIAAVAAIGGRGGFGGEGAQGGAGGAGGNASASASGAVSNGDVRVAATSIAGNGGNAGETLDLNNPAALSGNGGAAIATASATTQGDAEASASAEAYGGTGGGGYLVSANGVVGGQVVVDAYAYSALGDARAKALAVGGGGGGGDSANAVVVNAARGAAGRTLYLTQNAAGGSSGAGRAGDAFSSLTATNALGGSTFALVNAGGGDAHFSQAGAAITGGAAIAEAHISGSFVYGSANTGAYVSAMGGQGANASSDIQGVPGILRRAGDGGAAVVLPSSVTLLTNGHIGEFVISTQAIGGAGGDLGTDTSDASANNVGMMAGDGADVAMFNTVSVVGADTVRLTQHATGGIGGNGGQGGQVGNGGDAASVLDTTIELSDPFIRVVAIGGDAGIGGALDVPNLPVAKGGDASAIAVVRNDGGRLDLNGTSVGGNGNWMRGFDSSLNNERGLAADGGNAVTNLRGETSHDGADVFVAGTAHGGNGAWIDSLSGALRGGSAGNAVSNVVGQSLATESNVTLSSIATGGSGATGIWSTGHQVAIGRDGGTADASATAINQHGRETNVMVSAAGGAGGSAGGLYDATLTSGNGGAANAFATVVSTGGGSVTVTVQQIGGSGGGGLSGANGGDGAASHLLNAESIEADGKLTLVQDAQAGSGGEFTHLLTDHDVLGGNGGAASSVLSFDHEHDLDITVSARGGVGGSGYSINFSPYSVRGGHGGDAAAILRTSAGGTLSAETSAVAGDGGYDYNGEYPTGGEAIAILSASSRTLTSTAEHRANGLAVGGEHGGNAVSETSADVLGGSLQVKDVAFGYRGNDALARVASRARGINEGSNRLTVVSQALVGDDYFSSVGDPYLPDPQGPLSPSLTPSVASASAEAHGAGEVLAYALVASLETVDASASAIARSFGGRSAVAQAEATRISGELSVVNAVSESDTMGAVHRVAVHSETALGLHLLAGASLAADGNLDQDGTRAIDLAVRARGSEYTASQLYGANTVGAAFTLLGQVDVSASLTLTETLNAASLFALDADMLDPLSHLVIHYPYDDSADDARNGFTLRVLLDNQLLWQPASDSQDTGPLHVIDLGLVSTLMSPGNHELSFDFVFLPRASKVNLDVDISFGTLAPSAVPLPSALFLLLTALVTIAGLRRGQLQWSGLPPETRHVH